MRFSSFASMLLGGAAAMTLFVAASRAQGGNPETGRDFYMRFGCYACHGTSGQGGGENVGGGPKLAPNPLPYVAYEYQLRRPRGIMPIYTQKILSDAQLEDIYSYVTSIQTRTTSSIARSKPK